MMKWTMTGAVAALIVVTLFISMMFFPIAHTNASNSAQYPAYYGNMVVIAGKGDSIGNWSISNGSGAIMVNFTLSKDAIVTGSWKSTIPTDVYIINYTTNKTDLRLPSNSSYYGLSGAFSNTPLAAGKYYLIIGTIFHGNERVTINQAIEATYVN